MVGSGGGHGRLAVRIEKRLGQRLDELDMRLDDMAVTIERRAVESMSEDLAAVAGGLRKAVGDLARTLVRDRGRITNTLTEHRNAILAELRLPADPAPPQLRRLDLTEAPADDDAEEDAEEESALELGRRILRRRRGA